MVNKRKRDEVSDSDSDEVAPGKQNLPVANLPYDFDEEPQDGMQYLFLVRRDARRLPHVTRVHNPYEVSETRDTQSLTLQLSTNVLPCEEWRAAFQRHFSNMRKNLNQTTIHVGHDHSGSARRVIPEKKDRDAWWNFLAGHPEPVWSPKDRSVRKKLGRKRAPADSATEVFLGGVTGLLGVQLRDESYHLPSACFNVLPQIAPQLNSLEYPRNMESTDITPFAADIATLPKEVRGERLSPPEVTPRHLQEIDHRMSIHLLMYFTHWINVHLQNPSDPLSAISVSHGQWIFALLTRVEDQLSADEMHLLRNLARACLALIQRHRNKHAKNDTVSEVPGSLSAEIAPQMSDASCWIVIAAVAGHWGQRDLWADAEATLAGGTSSSTDAAVGCGWP